MNNNTSTTEKAIATADFRVFGKRAWDGKEVNTSVHLELHKSGAFDYGNGTMTIMKFEKSDEQAFDTRYEAVNANNFSEFAERLVKNYVADGLEVEPI